MYYLVKTACQCISPVVIVKGFQKCGRCSAMDGTDDDMLWNGSEEDRECYG